jgi:dCTP deaminase
MPDGFLLAWTGERIALPLPSRPAARAEGKSSLARFGLGVYLTTPTIHAGLASQIRLEMVNCDPNEIILNVDMPICN